MYENINNEPVIRTKEGMESPEATLAKVDAIGPQQLKEFSAILENYKKAKQKTTDRIKNSEEWWKLHNTGEEQKKTEVGKDGGFTSKSGWLHNVIVSKHADAIEAYPEPNILPREAGDKQEATTLSSIIPCILEQNKFEKTYSNVMWQKNKTGTGAYKIVWDTSKLNGLGDIGIEKINLLNVFTEPGVADIQKSRYFFHTELCDKDLLEQMYPDKLKDKLRGGDIYTKVEYAYDEQPDTSNKVTVIEVYYHKTVGGKNTLQYCKYVNDIVIFATENDPKLAERGLYDHGKYPYVFDPLFPIEGSPYGYGFVDICRNPQTEIDLLKTSIIKNAMVGSTPRYFSRADGGINEEEFADLNKSIVHVNGNLGEDSVRQIDFKALDGIYVSYLDREIQELRETSGNTESSTGSVSSGVTAASAIAALQEASGKGSRDSTLSAYRAYVEIIEFCIELIRQFYTAPRHFRITGEYGQEQFVTYSNQNLVPQHQGNDLGQDMGYRLPVFDIKVSAQKKNVYTKVTQNELALQFFDKGFFNPQMVDQALMCLEMMEFDGKDMVMRKIAKNGTMFQKLVQYMQMTLMLAQKVAPEMVSGLSQDIVKVMGANGISPVASGGAGMFQSDHIAGIDKKEPTIVANARARAGQASQPGSGGITGGFN